MGSRKIDSKDSKSLSCWFLDGDHIYVVLKFIYLFMKHNYTVSTIQVQL